MYMGSNCSIITCILDRVVEDITRLSYFFHALKCKMLARVKSPSLYVFIYLLTNFCFPLEKCREKAEAVLHGSKQGSKLQTQQIITPVLASCQLEPFNRAYSLGKCWPPNVPRAPVYVNTSGLGSACIYPLKREQLVHSFISSESHGWI